MKEYNTIKDVVNLIITEINDELSVSDKKTLEQWLNEDPKHQLIYNQIKSSKNFDEWKQKRDLIDSAIVFHSVFTQIQKNKNRHIFRNLLKIAAAIILPLLIAGGAFIYFSSDKKDIPTNIEVAEIKPGTTKAILKLENGQMVMLDSLRNETIKETDGTTIEKDKGLLSYKKENQSAESEKVIYNTIEIPRGGEFNLRLADGTMVYLNSMSRLKYPVNFSGDNREVELTGEAFFEVAHDSKHPFWVHTQNVTIEVLGTSFNINAYENSGKVITTLVDGKVKIKPNDNQSVEKILSPSEQASFDISTGLVDINTVRVELFTAWKEGKLIFYDNRLEEIMKVLTRWYTAEVIYQSPKVKDLRFSGKLNRHGDIQQILDIIKATRKVEIEINNNIIVFKER